MKIPSNSLWTQTNEGEITGILNGTNSVALDTIGQVKLARKPVALLSSASDSDFAYLMAIAYLNNKYIAVTSDNVFTGSLDGNNWTQETDFTPATTNASDAVVFNERLVVSEDNDLADWDGAGDDVYNLVSLTSGVPHPLSVFGVQLAVGDGNTVKLYNTSYVLGQTLTLPTEFQVTTIRTVGNFLYIGTKNLNGNNAKVFIWDGNSSAYDSECSVGAEWVFSMTEYGSSVAAITSSGQLIQVSGSQYVELAALPVYYMPHAKWMGANGLLLNGKVFNRGMVTNGKTIYINIEGETDTGFVPEMKSGVWVYDPEVGLYHRGTSSTDTLVEDNGLSLTDNTITTSTAHNLKTGDAVEFRAVSGIVGINNDYTYYVTVVSPTTIKLSLTRQGVYSQRYVSMTGTPAVGDVLVFYPNTDNGLQLTATSGAVSLTTINETSLDMLSSEVLWGSRTKKEDGTATYVINTFCEQSNIGSFTTQRIYSDNIEQNWNKIYAFLDGLVTETDTAMVKVQTKYKPTTIELEGVWASTTQLNSNNAEEYSAWGDIEVGDELVFTNGKGQGKTAHVVSIESSSTVYSLVVDEEIGTTSSTVMFYATPFKKVGTWTKDTKANEYITTQIHNAQSPWIKIKCELRGIDITVSKYDLVNAIHKSTV